MQSDTSRIAVVGIIVSNADYAEKVNDVLHGYSRYVLGRMGLPLRERGINAITVVIDAPVNEINALTGKLGKIDGVGAKALFR